MTGLISQNATTARHLLRALLRESTYLPDDAARDYIRRYVLARFKEYHSGAKVNSKATTGDLKAQAREDLIAARIPRKLKEARKGLSLLQRANGGQIGPLRRVLLHTYGRTGERRHELLKSLLKADAVSDSDTLTNLRDKTAAQTGTTTKWKLPPVVDRLRNNPSSPTIGYRLSPRFALFSALAESQTRHNPEDLRRTRLRSTVLKIPSTNAWARPMPQKRQKNMVWNWYGSLMDKILPPIPEHEWIRLKELVHGERKWEGVPARRAGHPMKPERLSGLDLEKLAETVVLDQAIQRQPEASHTSQNAGTSISTSAHHHTHATHKTSTDSWVQDPALVDRAMEDVLEDAIGINRLDKKLPGRERPHNLTPRVMRRLWGKIFTQCPLVDWDPESKRWNVRWGYLPNSVVTGRSPQIHPALFAGVDAKGKIFSGIKRHN